MPSPKPNRPSNALVRPAELLYPYCYGVGFLLLLWAYMAVAGKLTHGDIWSNILLCFGMIVLATGIGDIRSGSSRITRCLAGGHEPNIVETVFAYALLMPVVGLILSWTGILSGN